MESGLILQQERPYDSNLAIPKPLHWLKSRAIGLSMVVMASHRALLRTRGLQGLWRELRLNISVIQLNSRVQLLQTSRRSRWTGNRTRICSDLRPEISYDLEIRSFGFAWKKTLLSMVMSVSLVAEKCYEMGWVKLVAGATTTV